MEKELRDYPDLLSYLKALERRGVQPVPQASGFSLREYWEREELERAAQRRPGSVHTPGEWDWDDAWDTGIAFIDHEHQAFIEYVNTLYQSVAASNHAKIVSVIDGMLAHVGQHFDLEERLMELSGYPEREAHIVLHRTFRQIIDKTCNALLAGDRRSLWLLKDLRVKLVRHMVEEDQKYAPWLKQRLGNQWFDELWHLLIR